MEEEQQHQAVLKEHIQKQLATGCASGEQLMMQLMPLGWAAVVLD
jgi:hypothetical protein